MMRTANPALNDKTFEGFRRVMDRDRTMSIQGTVNKTVLLLVVLLLAAAWTWRLSYTAKDPGVVAPWIWGGAVGGFLAGLITVFKKNWAAVTGPVYAVLEGLLLGGLSAMLEVRYPGIVVQAVALTFGTLFGLLMAYKSGLIKATENFKLGVFAATMGIGLVYLATLALGLFGIPMPYIHESGAVGIAFSLFVVIVAALNLVLDFDFIESGAAQGAPDYMEWYAAFGLMVTLIWLYIEILRLLAKMRSRR
jgi:uncharacterized YccA/Bax inhibitor family protein